MALALHPSRAIFKQKPASCTPKPQPVEGDMREVGTLNDLRQHGKLNWSEGERAWAADPGEVVSALAHAGFQEYKRETTHSHRDRAPRGGVWQGLDSRTGAVASAIWVVRDHAAPLVYIDIDGEPVLGDAA